MRYLLIMSLFLSTNLYAGVVLKLLPDGGLNKISTDTLEFIDMNPGQSSGLQFNLFVKANSSIPWNINMKYDPFVLDGSTEIISYGNVTYIFIKPPFDVFRSSIMPADWETIYTSPINATGQYSIPGSTFTVQIDILSDDKFKTGKYRSNLHVELGDKL